jgi:hypothetical protein
MPARFRRGGLSLPQRGDRGAAGASRDHRLERKLGVVGDLHQVAQDDPFAQRPGHRSTTWTFSAFSVVLAITAPARIWWAREVEIPGGLERSAG